MGEVKYCISAQTGCSRFVRCSREMRTGAETRSELLTPALMLCFVVEIENHDCTVGAKINPLILTDNLPV